MHTDAPHDAPYVPPTLLHRYGDQVHVLHDPVATTELAQLSAKTTPAAAITPLVRSLYAILLRHVLAARWPRMAVQVPTRMVDATPRGVWQGVVLDDAQRAVVVDIARAGTVPAQLAYETLAQLLGGLGVRQDHLYMGRTTDASGAVDGVSLHGSKIGGPVAGAYVLVPDPMGATGTSMAAAIDLYKSRPEGPPAKLFALHLIVTPEYLAHMKARHPDVEVWAVRLDRGMSAPDLLATVPGTHWDQERGLNDKHYIVPGAGGLGELLNNAEA